MIKEGVGKKSLATSSSHPHEDG